MRKNNRITSPSEHSEDSLLLKPRAAELIHLSKAPCISSPRVGGVPAITVFNFSFMVLLKYK
jgi:hypothetical protein